MLTSHVDLKDVFLHYGTAGKRGEPPVLLLHGWPDLWFSWEQTMRALEARGYHTFAPDQRGYGRSSKPPHVRDYALAILTEDVVQLIERLQTGPVHLIGHDWGGVVAWSLALTRPDLVRTLTVVNAPHPWVFVKSLFTRPTQLMRSWYMFLFQIPGLAELLLGSNDAKLQSLVLEHGVPLRDASLLARYREQWRNPGAVRMPLAWYRALFRTLPRRENLKLRQKVKVPTLVMWGERDPAFAKGTAEASVRWCEQGELQTFPGGHWPFHQHAEPFQTRLLEWLEQHRGRAVLKTSQLS